MCLTVLPYKRIPDDQSWIREQGDVELSVHPIPNESRRRLGVPYGSKARLILLFLQTEAVKTRSRVVELGNSMNMWMARMGVSVGGTSYRIIEEQAERIEHSIITFSFRRSEGRIRWQDSIIRGSFDPFGRRGQEEFASKTVELSETFFEAIMRHPVPISERAIQLLGERCMPLDIYLWLAYRLHSLEDSLPSLGLRFSHNLAPTPRCLSISSPASLVISRWHLPLTKTPESSSLNAVSSFILQLHPSPQG